MGIKTPGKEKNWRKELAVRNQRPGEGKRKNWKKEEERKGTNERKERKWKKMWKIFFKFMFDLGGEERPGCRLAFWSEKSERSLQLCVFCTCTSMLDVH
jgi:hypothetical protein